MPVADPGRNPDRADRNQRPQDGCAGAAGKAEAAGLRIGRSWRAVGESAAWLRGRLTASQQPRADSG